MQNNPKDSPSTLPKKWPIVIAIAIIIVCIIGIIALSIVYGLKGGKYFEDYAVVMDAGSSKTNTIVYKWCSNKYRGTGRVFQEDKCKSKGGIAKMHPTRLHPVINCAKNVTSVIAPDALSKTPLFFAATAGMRLLKLTDPDRLNEILNTLREELPDTGLDVRAIEIISGRDEGIYGWITLNFLLNTLEEPQELSPWKPTTFGALDMGGASMQISYAIPNEFCGKDKSDVLKMKLYGQTYNVFSHSQLCFGRDESRNRHQALLMLSRTGNLIEDPCVPRDFNKTVTGAELFKPICSQFKLDSELSKLMNETFDYVGTSKPDACRKSVSQLLDDDLCKSLEFKECFKKYTEIPDDQKFLAFAGFYYTASFLNTTDVSLEKYEAVIRDFCLKNLEQVQQFNDPFGTDYCFDSQFMYQVLINGFGFSNDTWKNLEFVKKISGKDVGWTLGYMINATSKIPEKETPRLISRTSLAVSVTVLIAIILAALRWLL